MLNVEESMSFETLLSLFGENYGKAFEVYMQLKREVDISYPLPSYAERLGELIGRREEEIDAIWRGIRERYQHIRGGYEIIDDGSPLFPKELL